MDCPNMVEYAGERTYSNNIPAYAQGACFPADMPGIKCKKTGDYCPVDDTEDKRDCVCVKETSLFCPSCIEKDKKHWLIEFPDNTLICKHCNFITEDKGELLDAYCENIEDLMCKISECQLENQTEKGKKELAEKALKDIVQCLPNNLLEGID